MNYCVYKTWAVDSNTKANSTSFLSFFSYFPFLILTFRKKKFNEKLKEMAEILLTAVINKSIEIAGNVLFQEGTRLYWLKEDIDWLQREMRHIRSYVDNAKAKEVGGDSRVKNLLKDIQQLAGDVEDLLDEFLPKIQQSNKFICCLKTVSFADEFAMEIEKIKRRVADIDRVRTTYSITDTSNNNDDCIPLDRRRLFLHADETEVIGLEDDFNTLQAKLLDHDLPYGVVSIVGMPGLGKTTLAKKLYRHVCHQFECSGLVYVSQQPRAGEILHDIAKQVGLTEEERKENLENNLRSLLKIKRYVILLDDIWDVEIWDDLKLVLPECDSKIGSRIIITSRNSNVGRYIGGDFSIHVLQPLDSEKSFELFTKKIFNFVNDNWANASPDLVNIGRCIVERCGGIPLAIVVTAGMLRARGRTEHAWNRVLESMAHKIQDGCGKVLALSYNDLPIALRPCFLYFGLYPEDHEIRAFDLTNMWIAEKLIVVNTGNGREAESLADDVLNDLVSRNLIQVAKRTYDGRISSCRIHDLLHSLCVDLAKESNFFHTEHYAFGDPSNVARVRRITFYSDDNAMNEFFHLNPKPMKLRSLFCFTKDRCIFSQMAHLNFKLLQVLVVVMSQKGYQHVTFPKKIGNMSCLRYVRLEGAIRVKLPNSIVKLKCLETLDIFHSSSKLPFGVWESKILRHLCYTEECYCVSFASPFCRIMPPNNLQTLMWVDDKFCEPRLLHRLINLRTLCIMDVSGSTIKILSALSPVPKALEVLKLRFFKNTSEQINLSSHPNIVELGLVGFSAMLLNIEAFPPNLVKLNLVGLMVDGHLLAVLKKLPKLRILILLWCRHDAEKMDLSGDSFPQLEVLYIEDAQGLSEVTCMDDMSMPKLKKLFLVQGPNISPISLRVSERLAKLRISQVL
uniref:Late blight resistance protein n=1 Tax=Solanum venturii TaxID=610331 RepID=B7U1D8_9SOLN|nr:late blight resistance protein [Solanum venturii]